MIAHFAIQHRVIFVLMGFAVLHAVNCICRESLLAGQGIFHEAVIQKRFIKRRIRNHKNIVCPFNMLRIISPSRLS